MLFEGADGRLVLGGGPGGDFQLQAMAQVLARHLLCGEALDAAVRAPRVFTQGAPASADPHLAFPGRVLVEDGAPPDWLEGLARRGHKAVADRLHGSTRPSICLVAIDGERGAAVGDPRRAGGQRVVVGAEPQARP
jgi:gamma-glutamyltranspeptidase